TKTLLGGLIGTAILVVFGGHVWAVAPQTSNLGVSIEIIDTGVTPTPTPTATPVSPGGQTNVPITPPAPGEVVLFGLGYPESLVTILRNGAVTATLKAEKDGTFQRTLAAVPVGISTFSLFAEDRAGRKSSTISITINIASNTRITITGLFIPPTIDTPPFVGRRETFAIRGEVFPDSLITLFIAPEDLARHTRADGNGVWAYEVDAGALKPGSHRVRAKAQTEIGAQSEFSEERSFTVLSLTCENADLNGDTQVNIIDFSILLFWFGSANSCSDQNNDGIVDIIDFSILLFYWTG
ncbi:MAG: hypothetical protein HY459_02995, partial [Parcubacteria group bacterium]|nr:hypothetical protein [Parcubacteria group bacterium]